MPVDPLVVGGVACSGGLVVLLLRRLWRVRVVAAAHRKRLRRPRAWVELVSTWHTPLLLLSLAIVIARLVFFVERHVCRAKAPHTPVPRSQRERLWFLLEVPSAVTAVIAAYLIFFHAHVALYRVWPIRFDSTATAFRIALYAFCGLLLTVILLLAHARELPDPMLTVSQWTRLLLKYFAVVWVVLGAVFLKFQGHAADIMWAERDVGRLLVISPRGLHTLVALETLFALTMVARGILAGMVVITTATQASELWLPADPSRIPTVAFILLYGVWDVATIGVVYCLCGCVPVTSRARRLVGYANELANGLPIVTEQPVLHFTIPSPKQVVEGYCRSAAMVIVRRPTGRTGGRYDEQNGYEPEVDLEGDEENDELVEGDSFREPLLSGDTDPDDAESLAWREESIPPSDRYA